MESKAQTGDPDYVALIESVTGYLGKRALKRYQKARQDDAVTTFS